MIPQNLTLQSFLWGSSAPYTESQKEAMCHEGEDILAGPCLINDFSSWWAPLT